MLNLCIQGLGTGEKEFSELQQRLITVNITSTLFKVLSFLEESRLLGCYALWLL
jgi:hypothetical protein